MKPLIYWIALFVIGFSFPSNAQNSELLLHSNWKAKRASEVPADGTVISSPNFQFYDWMDAVVPGTVLTTLLENQKVPDPFFGLNNELIPDIYETGPDYYTFWFQNSFELPAMEEGRQIWLKFRGINYSANIFLNGKRVNTDTHEGMFLREKYNITNFISGSQPNNLAVKVEPPNPVGQANGGQGGDGTIARSVTQQFTPGWDWIQPVRDRNTGIWDRVSIEVTGPVDIRDPFVKSRVPGIRIPGTQQEPAFIEISTDLTNPTSIKRDGILTAKIGEFEWTQNVSIQAKHTIQVSFPEIQIDNPQLWWPNGIGDQPLYQLELRLELDQITSDLETVDFGIRETGNYFNEAVGGRVFLVNGQKVFIKGGNWISSDALLRLSPERYEAEVKMHARMNMNMIRIWGGSITERPEFYKACDKYGLLVWQDLWVTGDCNGRWPDPKKRESQERRRAYPDSHSLFITSMIDQIKMLRNHPSLYLWCGGNEFPPPDDINEILENEIFPKYDGTRYYVNESTSDSILRNTIGGNGDGPYGIQDPKRFFVTQSYPFNPELGSVGLPNVETMRKIMDEEHLTPPRNDRANRVWQYHKYIGYRDHIENFGEIKGIEDFCKKAQVVNYEQYRALQEGFNAGMWNKYTGMLVWKNQNPWTSLRGQFYDVFLDQNGGFYGYQHGAMPLHVQLNLNDSSICVVNHTCADKHNLRAEASYFDLHGNQVYFEKIPVSIESNTHKIVGKLNAREKPGGLWFLRLTLKNDEGTMLDENLYWLSKSPGDVQNLSELQHSQIQTKIDAKTANSVTAFIENTGNETAFFVRLKLIEESSGDMLLPVFFSDNYLTLFPGENRNIEIDLSHLNVPVNENIELVIEPWNGKTAHKNLF